MNLDSDLDENDCTDQHESPSSKKDFNQSIQSDDNNGTI
ncbi:unnamed protein product, partial [Rotaria magnacalcarata]